MTGLACCKLVAEGLSGATHKREVYGRGLCCLRWLMVESLFWLLHAPVPMMWHVCYPQAFDALPQGGAFVAIEVLIDDERRHNTTGLFMSLNMLLEFGEEHAFDYTFQV